MNETIRSILGRRSVRKYRPDPIPDAELDLIIQAGLYAASTKNTQSRHILILKDGTVIKELERQLRDSSQVPGFDRYAKLMQNPKYSIVYGNAPVFALVSGDDAESWNAYADCALVLGNMFTAAYSLGIGSCWINQVRAVGDESGFRSLLTRLGVPEGYTVYGGACFGYPADGFAEALPRKPEGVTII